MSRPFSVDGSYVPNETDAEKVDPLRQESQEIIVGQPIGNVPPMVSEFITPAFEEEEERVEKEEEEVEYFRPSMKYKSKKGRLTR